MKYRLLLLLAVVFIVNVSMQKDKPAYCLYNVFGKKTTFTKLVKDASICEVVLFGEIRNNPISHWLQLQLAKELFKIKKQNLILGAEMFESDKQSIIDDYLSGNLSEDTLLAKVPMWSNYFTDYRPLLEFARNTGVKFIATNIPARYSRLVYKEGFEALKYIPAEDKQFVAPYPIDYSPELEVYKKLLYMDEENKTGTNHASPNLPKSQASEDATISFIIDKHREKGKVFLHFNDAFHSDFYEGIMWYLKRMDPYMRILTIATVEQSDITELSKDNVLIADYIIVVPDDMTKTFYKK